MTKTKKYYSDRVMKDLQDAFPNADFRIGEREIFLVLDDVVNSMAKQNYFDNWKLFGAGTDEAFITTWDGDNAISVVDPGDGESPSYLELPAVPAALPRHGGIEEIWPQTYEFGAVRIMDHGDVRKTRRLMSGNMQGELAGFRQGMRFIFNQTEVARKYSEKFGVRLVVKDSTALSLTAAYPIPADLEDEVIKRVVLHFKERRLQPTDTVRDKQDAINRN